jgi:hypothetical protein
MDQESQNNLTRQLPVETRLANLRKAPRCGAKTRRKTACMGAAVRGSRRCRMHGGKGSGPPKGSQNALKHGRSTREAIAERREARSLIREWREFQDSCDF